LEKRLLLLRFLGEEITSPEVTSPEVTSRRDLFS
jgi:hypothetical protein